MPERETAGQGDAEKIGESEHELFDEIERLISLENCGIRIDWDSKEFYLFQLFQIWRGVENEIKNLRAVRLQSFIQNFKL